MIDTHEFDGFKLYTFKGVCLEGTQSKSVSVYDMRTRRNETIHYVSSEIIAANGSSITLTDIFGLVLKSGDEVTVIYEDISTPLAMWKEGDTSYSANKMLNSHDHIMRSSNRRFSDIITIYVFWLFTVFWMVAFISPLTFIVMLSLDFSFKSIAYTSLLMIFPIAAFFSWFTGKIPFTKDASHSEDRLQAVNQVWDKLSRPHSHS